MADNVLSISSYGNTNSVHGGIWDTNFNMRPDSKALAAAKNAALAALGPMTPAKAAKLRGKDMYLKTASGALMEASLRNVGQFTGTEKAKAEFKAVALRRAAIDDYIAYVDTKASTSRTKQKAISPNSTVKCPLNDCSEASFQLGAQFDVKYGASATSWNNDQFKYTDPVKFRKEIVNNITRAPSGPTPARPTSVPGPQPTPPPSVSEAKLKSVEDSRLVGEQRIRDEKERNTIAEEIIRRRRREQQIVATTKYNRCTSSEMNSTFTATQCEDMQTKDLKNVAPEGAPITREELELEKAKPSFPSIKYKTREEALNANRLFDANARASVARPKSQRKANLKPLPKPKGRR